MKLEGELHEHFSACRVNWVNDRKEFFFRVACRRAISSRGETGKSLGVCGRRRIYRVPPEHSLADTGEIIADIRPLLGLPPRPPPATFPTPLAPAR